VAARFRDGSPALLRLPHGHGTIYWLAASLEPRGWGAFLSFVAENSGLKPDLRITKQDGGAAPEVEYRVATFDGHRLAYFYNNSDRDVRLMLQPDFVVNRIIDCRAEVPLSGRHVLVPARDTAVLDFQ
jgi:hypothetical protein